MTTTLLDTGPLVAYLDNRDQWHKWAVSQWQISRPPFLTCESVICEACFLLLRNGGMAASVLTLLQRGILKIGFQIESEVASIESLMRRYDDTPMSLADACLVRLAELHSDCRVLTLDRDFTRYRRHGRQVIPLLAPWD
jgi:uncharacterized protein